MKINNQPKPIKKTYVAFILDKSTSMNPIRLATIDNFNEQLDEHRINAEKGGEVYLSLTQFNGSVSETFFNVHIDNIEGKLEQSEYCPAGSTAMYDAIGKTVTKLQRFDEDGDIGFLVIILSDGQENSSRQFDGPQIKSLVQELESSGRWTFQYIGCDANAIKDAQQLGFKTATFEHSKNGMDKLSGRLRGATGAYYSTRSAGFCSVENFLSDTDTQVTYQPPATKFPVEEQA